MTTEIKEAMQHPDAVYTTPEDVMDDKSLSYEDKLKILENWADEATQALEAVTCPA